MTQQYFSEFLPVLAERAKHSAIGRLGFANAPLQRHLSDMFSRPYGEPGAFLADPAFEAVFGWKSGDKKMSELAGNLLSAGLVNSMDEPPAALRNDYRFAKSQRPYTHQLEAWQYLAAKEPKSLIVASGTGSGKTECFMIPILDCLVREQERIGGKLIGVRALFLYPLNALINSQRDRFRAWTHAFGDKIRFCLYNGNTPERPEKSVVQHEYPSEVLDRVSLRAVPPPLLVTNATMLEYMLVRTADAPIISQSQGKLQWVVLDEAHTYVGSQAAEASLLIRRVLLAFGVQPEQVRFVATSATIGDPHGDAGKKLKRFLADVAGVSQDNVYLVAGQREIPALMQRVESDATLNELIKADGTDFEELAKNKTARRIRDLFTKNPAKPVARLTEVCERIFDKEITFSLVEQNEALKWLDLLSQEVKPSENGQAFLPLRAHVFHQTLSGIWACADAVCPEKGKNLKDKDWSFGQVYFEPRKHCDCGSPVYEIVKCDGCATVHLRAGIDNLGRLVHLQPLNAIDEFELDAETEEQNDNDEENETSNNNHSQIQALIVNQNITRIDYSYIERISRKIIEPHPDALKIRAYEDNGNGLICPVCEQCENSGEIQFHASRIGAPFLITGILPTLLEFAPDGEKPADFPCRGRRLLSFNDSRQGTARIAAKLQQEAERNRIRGLIYHLILSRSESGRSIEAERLRQEINQLKSGLNSELAPSLRQYLEDKLSETQNKLASLSQPKPISFGDLARELTQQGRDFDLMLKQYHQFSARTFPMDTGAVELAKMFLIREFGRRPKRMNNLETMGMVAVRYPALDNIREVPAIVSQVSGFNLTEWRDFLKICLDFFVRGGGSLEIERDWRNWLGMRYPQKFLVSRDEQNYGRNQRRWLRAKRSGRKSNIVRLLEFVLKADINTSEGEDRIDSLLEAAWLELNSFGLLKPTTDGRLLGLNQIEFVLIQKAWVCPITRRFLDVTLRGVSPYLPENKAAICEVVEIPLFEKAFAGVDDDLARIKIGREWLAGQNEITELREQGLWSAPNDRVIELSPYFTAGEHSAQQDSATLQRYEKKFKEGALNLLSCSTTMEMGIDIGGISIVAMNNVPPHPANYLQRAGRAGRRRETRSTAVTLCKSNPHDQNVFSNSRWAFDSSLPAPNVSLDSSIIVQRHINSFLLAKFFRENIKSESIKLTCGLFFLGENSLAGNFAAWCRAFDSEITDMNLKNGLNQLKTRSILEDHNHQQLLECTAESIGKIAYEWMGEWNQLEREEQEITNNDGENSAALRAVSIHKKRLADEYLLRELATRGFLPGYGFPTNIAAFDNLTIGKLKETKQGREDNRYRRRELASRDLTTALREYAPGSEVVMDGLVYVSAGVTLNWHIPADLEDVKEIQNIRVAWRCKGCGASGSGPIRLTESCEFCGSESREFRDFLEPAGFAVDFYKEPGNDVSTQHFIPVEPSWIGAGGDWFSLPNPALGRFRLTTSGHIFNQSRGIYGTGYAVCLECGRTEPMQPDKSLPKTFQEPHRKLRRNREDGTFCPGSFDNWKIKQEITLGHESRTDMFELQLKNSAGVWLNDETTALTLAVVFRDALAELLGVQSSELGCDIKQARTDSGICQSIIIFDRFAAGYASSADRFLPELFQLASRRLDCPAKCDSVCPHCVLDYDQRFAVDNLDRRAANEFLSVEWLNSLRLPDDFAFFGQNSCLEHRTFSESLLLAIAKGTISKVRFYTSPNVAEWDVAASPLRELAYKIAGRNIEVEIMAESETIKLLSVNDRFVLASLCDHPRINLRHLDFKPLVKNGFVLAETAGSNSIRWAVGDENSLLFNPNWGTPGLLVRAENCETFSINTELINTSLIRPNNKELGDREISIKDELNGLTQGFGKRFWDFIKFHHLPIKELLEKDDDTIVSVSYTDRYLISPLTLALLYQMITALKAEKSSNSTFNFQLTTMEHYSTNSKNKIWANWEDSDDRDRVSEMLFNQPEILYSVESLNKSDVSHGRILKVEFLSGKTVSIRFDQGLSYWTDTKANIYEKTVYNFNADFSIQRDKIKQLNIFVESGNLPTQIFLKIRE